MAGVEPRHSPASRQPDFSDPTGPRRVDVVVLLERYLPYLVRARQVLQPGFVWFGGFKVDRGPKEELIVRPHAESLKIIAALAASPDYDPEATGISREQLIEDAVAGIRAAATLHITGRTPEALPLPEGMDAPWGDAWQSTLWTASLCEAAGYLGDALPAGAREALGRVVAFEADRFLGVSPPDGRVFDTKAEENAWDALLLTHARFFLPDHPNAQAWDEKAKEFAINSFTVPLDRTNASWLEDRPVNKWISCTTMHPDYTVENHGSFHPCYQMTFGLCVAAARVYERHGAPVPPHFLWNIREVVETLMRFILPGGRAVLTNGNDWLPFHPILPAWAEVAHFFRDGRAKRYMRLALQRFAKLQEENPDGRVFGRFLPPDTTGYPFWHHTLNTSALVNCLELLPLEVKEQTAEEVADQALGTAHSPWTALVVTRSRRLFASFTWRNLWQEPMGVVLPIDGDDWGSWPADGLVGRFAVSGQALRRRVVTHTESRLGDGFLTHGVVEYAASAGRQQAHPAPASAPAQAAAVAPAAAALAAPQALIRQFICAASFPEHDALLLVDYAVALRDVDLAVNEGLSFAIENDAGNQGVRRIDCGGAHHTVTARPGETRTFDAPDGKIAIDGKLAIRATAPLRYVNHGAPLPRFNRWAVQYYDEVIAPGETGPVAAGTCLRRHAAVFAPSPDAASLEVEGDERTVAAEVAFTGGKRFRFEWNLEPPYTLAVICK